MDNIEKVLHFEVQKLVDNQEITAKQAILLIRLQETVNRFAGTAYIAATDVAKLEERYGAKPSIATWGEYFQVETAYSFIGLSEKDSTRIVDTIYYDLIAAIKIFQGKAKSFGEDIGATVPALYARPRDSWTEEDAEQAHLYVLWQYYQELGLTATELSYEDNCWFSNFVPDCNYAIA